MRNLIFAIILIFIAGIEVNAQNDSLKHRPFHLSLITPLSTNGLESYKTVNDFSLSLFYSGSAGVSGLELGGFMNYTHYYVEGLQFAGFANVVRRRVSGIQAAGFSNVTLGDQEGIQMAGFTNIVNSAQGIQMAGFMNLSESIDGMQMAGFTNISSEVEGIQLAGFLNIAGTLKGMQLGFINIVDSVDQGIPMGFLSIVGKNGYHVIDLWSDELLNLNVAYKLGVPYFYNIFGGGMRFTNDNNYYALSYGVGSELKISSKWSIHPEVMGQSFIGKSFMEDEEWHTIFTFRPLLQYRVHGPLSINVGPNCRWVLTEGEEVFFRETIRDWIIDQRQGEVNKFFWLGVTAGISFDFNY